MSTYRSFTIFQDVCSIRLDFDNFVLGDPSDQVKVWNCINIILKWTLLKNKDEVDFLAIVKK